MITALYRLIVIRANLDEARELIDQLLALEDGTVSLPYKADFRLAAGRIAWAADRYAEARNFFVEAQRLYDNLKDEAGSALAGAFQGVLDGHEGKPESAERHFERALSAGRTLQRPFLEAFGLTGLGSIAMDRGDLARARELTEQSLVIYQRQKDYWIISLILWSITRVAIAQRDHPRARSALAEWTSITRDLGNEWAVPYILDFHGIIALDNNQGARAARLFGAADAMRERFAAQLSPVEQSQRDAALARLRQMLPEKDILEESQKGRQASPWELAGQ
jgi:tetratricopeptide (TPR) repeat protein